jgi:hypothetical protein
MFRQYSSLKFLLIVAFVGLSGCQFSKVDPDEAVRKQQEEQQRQKDKEQAEKSFAEKMTLAIQQNDLKAFEALIATVSVAELENANENGEMWFHEVIRKDRYHFAAALIQKGLSVFKVEERSGLSPLELAKKSSHAEILALLENAAKAQFQEVVQLLEAGELQKALELQKSRGLSLEHQNTDSKTVVVFVLQNISAYKKADMPKFEEFVIQAPRLASQELNQLFEAKSDFSEGFFKSLIAHASFQSMSIQDQESFLVKAYKTTRFGKSSKDLALKSLSDISFSGSQQGLNLVLADFQEKQKSEKEFIGSLEILALSKNAGLIGSFADLKSLIVKINQASANKLSDFEKVSELLLKMLGADLAMDFANIKDLQSQGAVGLVTLRKVLAADRMAVTSDLFHSATAADRAQVFEILKQLSATKQKVLAPQAAQLLRLAKDQVDYDLIFDRVLADTRALTQEQWLQQLMVILEKRWNNTSGLTDLFSTRASFLLNEDRWKALDDKEFHSILDKEARFVVIGELDAKPAQVFRAMVHARGRKMTDGLVLRFGTQDYHISNYSFFIAVHLARSPSAGSKSVWSLFERFLTNLTVSMGSAENINSRLFWNDLVLLSAYGALEKEAMLDSYDKFSNDLKSIDQGSCSRFKIEKMYFPFGVDEIMACYRRAARPVFATFETHFSKEFLDFLKSPLHFSNRVKFENALTKICHSTDEVQFLALASITQLRDFSALSSLPKVLNDLRMAMPSRDKLPIVLIGQKYFFPLLRASDTTRGVVENLEALKLFMLKTSPRLVFAIASDSPGIMSWVHKRLRKDDFLCGKDFKESVFLDRVFEFGIKLRPFDLPAISCSTVSYNDIRFPREVSRKVRIGGREVDTLFPTVSAPADYAYDLVKVRSGSEYQWIMFLREMDTKRDQLHPLAVQWLDSLPRFLFEK